MTSYAASERQAAKARAEMGARTMKGKRSNSFGGGSQNFESKATKI